MPDERQVVGAVIVADGKAFVLRRSADRRLFPNCWDIPGGHVEPGESLLGALRREIEEETGWTLAAVRADLGTQRWAGDDDGSVQVEHDYLVAVEGDLSNPRLEQDKHPEHRWVGPPDLVVLAEGRAPGDQLVLGVVRAGLLAAGTALT
ncbi:MAG: NUDIX hydrolase [Acidimicrobiales bacterium]